MNVGTGVSVGAGVFVGTSVFVGTAVVGIEAGGTISLLGGGLVSSDEDRHANVDISNTAGNKVIFQNLEYRSDIKVSLVSGLGQIAHNGYKFD
jgi:hypothetical protein